MYGTLRRNLAEKLRGHERLVVWGAGSGGARALSLLPRRVSYVADTHKAGGELMDLPVKAPDALKNETDKTLVIIASVAEQDIRSWIAERGLKVSVASFLDLLGQTADEGGGGSRLAIDMYCYWQGSWFETILRKPQCIVNVSYRLCRQLLLHRGWMARMVLIPARIWHTFNCFLSGIELPIEVDAGPGLQFAHAGAIVLHKQVRLGRFCTLYHCTTLGTDKSGKVPVLGDHVTIWAGAVVIGECCLGDFTEVGANATCVGPLELERTVLASPKASVVKTFD